MRYLVISDIHANSEALEAVLDDAPQHDRVLCLGDLVGYGPNPNECVDRVRGLDVLECLLGNHDCAALGELDLSTFNPDARRAAEWTSQQLRDDTRQYLASLRPRRDFADFVMAHASPRDPIWEYIVSPSQGPPNFAAFDAHICFVGHTHVPSLFTELSPSTADGSLAFAGDEVNLSDGQRRIVNPGSVGQPRDGDPRAAYGLYDQGSGTFGWHRVHYGFEETQRKIREAHLPDVLASRLSVGL